MKSLVIYSSKTGNTKMVAEAIAEVLPNVTLSAVENAPDYVDYDVIAIGFWVDKGMPNKEIIEYCKTVNNKNVFLFGTLGAYPDSDHGKECMAKSEALLNEEGQNNQVLGSFLCMGKVDPKILEMMAKMREAQKHHPMTEERKNRIEEAKKHPNEEDLTNAKNFALACLEKMK